MSVSLLLAILLAAAVPANARQPGTPPIFKLLRTQGFSASLAPSTKIRHLGRIVTRRQRYDLHYYDHVSGPSRHGLQLVIVVRGGVEYVGFYEANMADCSVRRNALFCQDPLSDWKGIVRFADGRLPKRLLIGGAYSDLTR